MTVKYVEINGVRFAALTLQQLRENETEVSALFGADEGERPFSSARFGRMLKVYHLSASRCNDAITVETLEGVIDLGSLADINRVVLGSHPQLRSAAEGISSVPTGPQTGGGSTRE